MNTKYQQLLQHFQTFPSDTNLLETNYEKYNYYKAVTMDDIHDSIMITGVEMDAPLRYYIAQAKYIALYNNRNNIRRLEILMENAIHMFGIQKDEFFNISDYGFNTEEMTIIDEILNGVPAYKSKITRRQYSKLVEQIREKARSYQ